MQWLIISRNFYMYMHERDVTHMRTSGEGLNSSAHMLRCVHVRACKHSTYPARATCKRTRAGAQGFRPCERSPCEPLGEVLLNPTGPRRSLTRMDLPARKPWGIRIVTIAARHCRRSSPTNNTTWEFKKRKLFQMKNQKNLEFLWVVFRVRFLTQIW